MIKLKVIFPLLFLLVCHLTEKTYAQNSNNKKDVYVDDSGVMRWGDTKKEVKGFGVNYSAPFAHVYRSALREGVYIKEEIDKDVYHLSRLGFDLYRIHVWDTEISDTLGNLIENEHLDTFDYLLKKLKDKGFNYVITPIAFWGNGWPEPDEKTPGFSYKYGKNDCLHNPEAIKAQHNYLKQFLNHVNPYTGIAYKNDPSVIAFEISNEPHHSGEAEKVTEFVSGMVDAMLETGLKKPIFYNISHGVHFSDAYFKGGIQGGTFQWYPTGLGYQRELPGNLLPNVNDYNITFDETIKKHKGAKLVYEFDAADVGRSYIYPVMARSFREAGIQIATHFAYDPTFLADVNTEYNTHYMNLAYTPQKALALVISSEVFHEIPMYSDFGPYPNNLSFDKFKVSYHKDLAEYNSEEKFIYTNSTKSRPANEKKLKKIAGFGNSSIISYDGLGAYFLDKIEKGLWRLEVMPDAVWVDNPFGRNSPKKTVGVIKHKKHSMGITLGDLGDNFSISAINDGNTFAPEVRKDSFMIMPGTYMLLSKESNKKWKPNDSFENYRLKDFYAPNSNVLKPWIKLEAPDVVIENTSVTLSVQYIAPEEPDHIELRISGFGNPPIEMKSNGNYMYSATIPADKVKKGYCNYNIVVKTGNEYITYPAAKEGEPSQWDYFDRSHYELTINPEESPIYLFNAKKDVDKLVRPWRNSFRLLPSGNPDEAAYELNIERLFVPDNENLNAKPLYDYSFKHFIIDKLKGNRVNLKEKESLVIKGRSLNDKVCKLQIAMVMNDGSSFGKIIELQPDASSKDYTISLDELKRVKTVTLPRPYPSFLPYYLEDNINSTFDISKVESIQFSIGPGIPDTELQNEHGISLISVRLE
ncbi:MAG: hypothetical protein WBG48_10005 [Pricia sp.]